MLLFEELWPYPPLLLIVLLISHFFPLARETQPVSLLQLAVRRLGQKVNPPHRSRQQQRLSGSLALLVVVFPFLGFVAFFYWVSSWPLLLDALVLFFCLDTSRQLRQHAHIAKALGKEQISLARDLLQREVLRDCSNLSKAGICKASIEHQALQLARQWFATLFWFLLGGGLLALAYRLVLLCNQEWNKKLTQFHYFGQSAHFIAFIGSMPGYLCLTLLYGLFLGLHKSLRSFKKSKSTNLHLSERLVLAPLAEGLQINLAGPVMYQAIKVRRDRIGPAKLPNDTDLALIKKLHLHCQLATYCLLTTFSVMQVFSILY